MNLTVLDSDHVRALVAAVDDAGTAVDVSSAPVRFAFVAQGVTPAAADWHAGEWSPQNPKIARIYVGPKGLPLPVGVYAVWVDIASATSGDPVRPYDILTIG